MVAWRWLLLVVVLAAGCDEAAAPVRTRIRNAFIDTSAGSNGSTMIVEGDAPPDAQCQVLTSVERSAQPGAAQIPLPDEWQTVALADRMGWVRVEQSIGGAQQAATPYVLVRLRCQLGGDSELVGVQVQ